MPSPIIAWAETSTTSATAVALSSGRSSARTSPMPAWSASARRCGVVAGEHRHPDPAAVQRADDLGNLWAQFVTHPIAPTGWSPRCTMTTVIPSDSIARTWSASDPASSQRGYRRRDGHYRACR